MKKSLIAAAVALSIGIPAVPAHAGLLDGFFSWVQGKYDNYKKRRQSQKQGNDVRGTAVSRWEQSDIQKQILPGYGSYNRSKECWGSRCMTAEVMNKATTREGTIYYVLATDENVTMYDMYALQKESGKYRVISKMHHAGMGISGDAIFTKLGKDIYGWNILSGDKGQSKLMEDYYAVYQGKIQHVASIQEYARSAPSNNASILTGDTSIASSWRHDGFYPIKVDVSGIENAQLSCGTCEPKGGRRISSKTYVFEFDQQKGRYKMPSGYPMTYQRF